jgi:hypothetical protein
MKIVSSLISFSFIAISSITQAQKVTLNVNEGQKFLIISTSDSKSSFSVMGRDMENSSKTITNSTAIFANKTATTMDLTVTADKLKTEVSAMGQEMSYDSDKKDNDEKMAEIMKEFVGKSTVYYIDNDGKVLKVVAPKINEESTAAITSMMGSSSLTPTNSDLYIAHLFNKDLKVGMSWSDSTETKGDMNSKTVNNYAILSIDNDFISLSNKGNILSDGVMKQMNMEMKATSNNKFTSTYKVNIKTGLIVENDINTEMNSNVEAGGMNIAVTGNSSTKMVLNPVK